LLEGKLVCEALSAQLIGLSVAKRLTNYYCVLCLRAVCMLLMSSIKT